jgi:hypothetical protein
MAASETESLWYNHRLLRDNGRKSADGEKGKVIRGFMGIEMQRGSKLLLRGICTYEVA